MMLFAGIPSCLHPSAPCHCPAALPSGLCWLHPCGTNIPAPRALSHGADTNTPQQLLHRSVGPRAGHVWRSGDSSAITGGPSACSQPCTGAPLLLRSVSGGGRFLQHDGPTAPGCDTTGVLHLGFQESTKSMLCWQISCCTNTMSFEAGYWLDPGGSLVPVGQHHSWS